MSKKEQNIETGDISGIGHVVGNKAESHVNINTSDHESAASPNKKQTDQESIQLVIVRVVMFVLGVLGILLSVVLFIRMLGDVESQLILGLILSVFVSVLGVLGVIKGESIIEIFGKLFSGRA